MLKTLIKIMAEKSNVNSFLPTAEFCIETSHLICNAINMTNRSSRPEVFCKKGFLNISQNS